MNPSKMNDAYDLLVIERFQAMVASRWFSEVRRNWLAALGKRSPFRSFEQWVSVEADRFDCNPGYRERLESDVELLSVRFALPGWHVRLALFVEEYSPLGLESGPFPKDLRHPRTSLIVSGPGMDWFEVLAKAVADADIQLRIRNEIRRNFRSRRRLSDGGPPRLLPDVGTVWEVQPLF